MTFSNTRENGLSFFEEHHQVIVPKWGNMWISGKMKYGSSAILPRKLFFYVNSIINLVPTMNLNKYRIQDMETVIRSTTGKLNHDLY